MATSDKTIVVNPALRLYDVEQLQFKEIEPGLFKRADPEGAGTMHIDYRPTSKNLNGFPKGRLYVRLSDGSYKNDEKEICEAYEPLGKHRLFQQRVWAEQNLDGDIKTVAHEDNVEPETKEIKVGRDLQERVASHSAKTETPTPARHVPAKVDPAQSNKPVINNEFMGTVADTPEELVVTLGGKRYATKNGRWYAVHASGMKIKKCSVDHIRWSFDGKSDGQIIAICKSMVIVDDGTPEGRYFEAFGVAAPDTVSAMIYGDVEVKDKFGNVIKDKDGNPKIKHINHLDHMAETRAENRCIGKIIAGGWFLGTPNEKLVQEIKKVESCTAEELDQFAGSEGGD